MNTMSSEVSTSYIFQARNYTTMLSEYQKLESWRPLQGIRAVSVHQLLNARTSASDGNKFELADGIPITDVRPQSCMISSSHSRSYNGLQFTIVAQVLSVVVSPVNTQNESKTTTYTLQDGSGVDNQHTITCIHTHHLRSPRLEFRYGYARVVGTPKKTPRNTIRVAHITPIVDANEIYCHLLEVMVSAHTFAQGVPVGQSCIRGFDNNPDDYLQPPKRINTLSSPRKMVPPSPPSKVYETTHFAVTVSEPSTFTTLPSKKHSNTHYPNSFNSGAILVNDEAGPSRIAQLDVDGCNEYRIPTTASPCKKDDDEMFEGPMAKKPKPTGSSKRLAEHRKDPYDHLTSLQRNVMLQLLNSSKMGGTYGDGGVNIGRVVHGIGRSAKAVEIEYVIFKFSQNLFLTYYRNALDSLTADGYIETKDGGDTYYVVGLGDVCYTNLSWE